MKRFLWTLVFSHRVSGVVVLTTALGTISLAAAELRLGVAAVNINPPNGTPLAGYYHQRGCQGVQDDLLAKASVLDDGTTKVALVVCDLISLPRDVVNETRKLIATQTGIPGNNVMLSATHSHTGPVLKRGSVRDNFDGANSDLSAQYTARLPQLIAQAVKEAQSRLAPTLVSHAVAMEPELSFNRRFHMRDGTVGWNPGKFNPKIMRPAGPIDPEVAVAYFETPARKPQLTYVNFALHPDTTGGQLLSADYPGALARCMATWKGPEMLTLFANGPCGNLNHVNVNWSNPQKGTNEANRIGTILAAAAFKACQHLIPVSNATLSVSQELLQLPLPTVTEDDAREAREIVAKGSQAKFMDQVKAYKVLDVQGRKGQPHEVEVQVIALGDALAWVSLPGEIFVELGLSIKAASPFQRTYLAELANGAIGYIPNRSAYPEGAYEVVSARCAEGSGEMLVAAAVRMLKELGPNKNEAKSDVGRKLR